MASIKEKIALGLQNLKEWREARAAEEAAAAADASLQAARRQQEQIAIQEALNRETEAIAEDLRKAYIEMRQKEKEERLAKERADKEAEQKMIAEMKERKKQKAAEAYKQYCEQQAAMAPMLAERKATRIEKKAAKEEAIAAKKAQVKAAKMEKIKKGGVKRDALSIQLPKE